MEEENDVLEVVTPEVEVKEPANQVPYERFAKEVARRKNLEEQLATLTQREKQVLPEKEVPTQFDSLVDNLSVLKNLDDDEVTELKTRATELGADPILFAKSPVWKTHLDHLRVSKSAELKTPSPSHRTAVYEGKTFADIVAGDDDKAKQQAFIAQRDAILGRGRNQMI